MIEETSKARLDRREAAIYLGISRETLGRMTRSGKITFFDLPGGHQFEIGELDRFIESRRRPAKEATE